MTTCQNCGEATGRRFAKYCDRCRPRAWAHNNGRRKWVPTAELDAVIREVWRSPAYQNKAYRVVQKRTGTDWPKWKICRRAIELGVARRYPKERVWFDPELGVLRRYAYLTPDHIAKKLNKLCGTSRTNTSIVLKRRRLELLSNREFYSATHVGRLLGEDVHRVRAWIEWGWLKATKRQTARLPQQGGDMHAIWPSDVRQFIFEHPEEIDLAKVDKWWFLETLTGGRIRLVDEPWRRPLPARRRRVDEPHGA